MSRVKRKVELVTGGRRGLGKAIAIMLAKEGATLVISDYKNGDAEAVMQEIE